MRSEPAVAVGTSEPDGATPSVIARDVAKTDRLGEYLRLEGTVRALLRRRREPERFEALRGVSFETQPGECFGIVGTNGSGKSTVLQVLSGITLPTRGEMMVRGSVLPLLAVAPGFHLELTGRENSFLFGTILGLDRALINSRLDDIARFAELERHFDTPIKRYSTGMQSRLCFAIAMLFPAAIYCFDEVLAVVDGEFKERCLQEIPHARRRGWHSVLHQSRPGPGRSPLRSRPMARTRGRSKRGQALGDSANYEPSDPAWPGARSRGREPGCPVLQ